MVHASRAGSVSDTKHRREMFLQSLLQQARVYGIDPSSIRMQAGDDDGRGGIAGQDPGAVPESATATVTTIPENAELPQDCPHEAPPYQTRMI